MATKFVNGQNEGAAPVNTQVLDNDIKVILPAAFENAETGVPMRHDRHDVAGGAYRAPPAAVTFQALRSCCRPSSWHLCDPQRSVDGRRHALVALGLTLIYGVLHIINFAHGALLSAALFAAFSLIVYLA